MLARPQDPAGAQCPAAGPPAAIARSFPCVPSHARHPSRPLLALFAGVRCLMGVDSQASDHCGDAWLHVLFFVLFDVLFNLLLLLVVKWGSASLM